MVFDNPRIKIKDNKNKGMKEGGYDQAVEQERILFFICLQLTSRIRRTKEECAMNTKILSLIWGKGRRIKDHLEMKYDSCDYK